jgi:DNA-binding NtrC family response regulator
MQSFSPARPLPEMSRPLVIVGHSPVMCRIADEIAAAAQSNVTILIAGESGTGRRLIARTIHDHSPRHTGPYVLVNCISLPDARLESELFGDAPGADGRPSPMVCGRLEAANGGTLVLQDVGYLSWRLQGRLLRHTDARASQQPALPLSPDVRLMAITNRRLLHALANQAFRDDLFYRLNVMHIEVPPLRERTEDIAALLRYFFCVHAARLGRPIPGLAPDALNCLLEYDWPGNVRELKELSERLVQTVTADRVGLDDLPAAVVKRSMSNTVARWGHGPSLISNSL